TASCPLPRRASAYCPTRYGVMRYGVAENWTALTLMVVVAARRIDTGFPHTPYASTTPNMQTKTAVADHVVERARRVESLAGRGVEAGADIDEVAVVAT
ncbi:hypothetical protein FOZ63_021744, partial [Perkinsus olseni]